MPRGGRRAGAGRPFGSKNKPRQIVDLVLDDSSTPLDGLMKIARDVTVDIAIRVEALRSAAPFVHPRLRAKSVAKVEAPRPTNSVFVSPVPTGRYLSTEEAKRLSGEPSFNDNEHGIVIDDNEVQGPSTEHVDETKTPAA